MCRFTVRPPPNAGPVAHRVGQLKPEPPIDLDALFQDDCDLDASDLELLSLFAGPPVNGGEQPGDAPVPSPVSSSPGATANGSSTVVMGQALCLPAGPQGLAAAPALVAAPNAVQQLQLQAVMQHQAAIMQNPAAYPAAAQMYQQALLQQQQHAMAPAAAPPAPLCGKRGKSQEEVEEQTERIKKRRRESAQRSRQRKNAYMRSLEMENRALKMENERLRVELTKSGSATALAAACLPKASCGSSRHGSALACSAQQDCGADQLSLCDDEGEAGLCDGLDLAACLAAGPPVELGGDALALMPTADLLSFAF